MRLADHRVWLPALAFVAFACAPCHRSMGPHGPAMGIACGPDACVYRSMCFSDGAVRSNDGVCQTCSGGKWSAATGCSEHVCPACDERMGKKPCGDHDGHAHRRPVH